MRRLKGAVRLSYWPILSAFGDERNLSEV